MDENSRAYLNDARLLALVSRVKVIHAPEGERGANEFNLCGLVLIAESRHAR